MARVPERGARRLERQSSDQRARPDWPGSLAQRQRRAVANNLTELHSRSGDAALFVDERGQRINGQWTGSPAPVEHDVLTGSNADGTLPPG